MIHDYTFGGPHEFQPGDGGLQSRQFFNLVLVGFPFSSDKATVYDTVSVM